MQKVMLVFGTRPEAIKMCPLVVELKKKPQLHTLVCVSGQHRDMLQQVLERFDVVPNWNLDVMLPQQSLNQLTCRMLHKLDLIFAEQQPDVVVVHGDTSTAFCAALAAFYRRIPVAHVEAGLRTYNNASPFPEEFNRQAVDSLSSCFFAPTSAAKNTLLHEQKPADRIFVTGNTVIDALRTTVTPDFSHPLLDWAKGHRLVLLTVHRRENIGQGQQGILQAVLRVVQQHPDVRVVYPLHQNPAVREPALELLGNHPQFRLCEPLEVLAFHNIMARCHLILTDSGGLQEEAPALGKPVLVLRDTTERPEGVEAGTLLLAGTEEEPVYRAFTQLLEDSALYKKMSTAANPYGDGFASQRIADLLERLDF